PLRTIADVALRPRGAAATEVFVDQEGGVAIDLGELLAGRTVGERAIELRRYQREVAEVMQQRHADIGFGLLVGDSRQWPVCAPRLRHDVFDAQGTLHRDLLGLRPMERIL